MTSVRKVSIPIVKPPSPVPLKAVRSASKPVGGSNNSSASYMDKSTTARVEQAVNIGDLMWVKNFFIKHPELLKKRLEGLGGLFVAHEVTAASTVGMLHLIADLGADLNSKDIVGQTPLMHAAYSMVGDREPVMMELVKKYRVPLNTLSDEGQSALDIAITHRQFKRASLLVNLGAKVTSDTRNIYQRSVVALEFNLDREGVDPEDDPSWAQLMHLGRLLNSVKYNDLNVGNARVTRKTERIGANVMPVNNNNSRRYFYNTRNVLDNGTVPRVFDEGLLSENMKYNPFTRKEWPLTNANATRQVLRRVNTVKASLSNGNTKKDQSRTKQSSSQSQDDKQTGSGRRTTTKKR